MDALQSAQSFAPPLTMRLHAMASSLLPAAARSKEGLQILAHHPAFERLLNEAKLRYQWESKVTTTGNRASADSGHRPVSTYMCSLADLLAVR